MKYLFFLQVLDVDDAKKKSLEKSVNFSASDRYSSFANPFYNNNDLLCDAMIGICLL